MLYFIIFLLVIVEGPIVTIAAGFMCAQGLLDFYLATLIIILGDLTGDALYYASGRWGMRSIINRWGKYVGFTEQKIRQFEKYFIRHGGKTVLIAKLAHGVGGVFLAAAGASHMKVKSFIFYSVIGTIPKTFILLFIGYYFGSAINKINNVFDFLALLVVAVIIGVILFYYLVGKFGKKINEKL